MRKTRKRGTTLDEYIEERKKYDPEFADGFDEGLRQFQVSLMLKMARKESKMTQTEVAERMGTTKSVISRLENRAEGMTVGTLLKFLDAVGKEMRIA